MHPVSCANTHHDVTDLVHHGMVENTKIWISWVRNITFLQNKKIINLCLRWQILRSYHFVAEVGFKLTSFPFVSPGLVFKFNNPDDKNCWHTYRNCWSTVTQKKTTYPKSLWKTVKHTHLKQVTLLLTFVSFGLPNIFWIFFEHILNFM